MRSFILVSTLSTSLLMAMGACTSDKEITTSPDPVISSIYQEADEVGLEFTPNLAGAREAAATTAQQLDVLNRINAIRAKTCKCGEVTYASAPALTLNTKLNTAADKHAVDMASKNYFSHTGKDGSNPGTRITREGYVWTTYGENIAAGYATTAQVVDGWRASPGHCANIMNRNVKQLGFGYGSNNSSTYKKYWVGLFATPR
ncbi:CAP domain-containing protein [Spirosoma daeguense]